MLLFSSWLLCCEGCWLGGLNLEAGEDASFIFSAVSTLAR